MRELRVAMRLRKEKKERDQREIMCMIEAVAKLAIINSTKSNLN